MYWKLYVQMLRMLSDKSSMKSKIMEHVCKAEKLTGLKLKRKVNREFLKAKISAYSWLFVWICLIKPLGQFFSRIVKINGTYQKISDEFSNINVVKNTTYKMFGVPIWKASNQKLSKEDIKELMA